VNVNWTIIIFAALACVGAFFLGRSSAPDPVEKPVTATINIDSLKTEIVKTRSMLVMADDLNSDLRERLEWARTHRDTAWVTIPQGDSLEIPLMVFSYDTTILASWSGVIEYSEDTVTVTGKVSTRLSGKFYGEPYYTFSDIGVKLNPFNLPVREKVVRKVEYVPYNGLYVAISGAIGSLPGFGVSAGVDRFQLGIKWHFDFAPAYELQATVLRF